MVQPPVNDHCESIETLSRIMNVRMKDHDIIIGYVLDKAEIFGQQNTMTATIIITKHSLNIIMRTTSWPTPFHEWSSP